MCERVVNHECKHNCVNDSRTSPLHHRSKHELLTLCSVVHLTLLMLFGLFNTLSSGFGLISLTKGLFNNDEFLPTDMFDGFQSETDAESNDFILTAY